MYFVEDGLCSLHLSRSRVASPVHYLLKESTFSVEETLWKNFIDWFLERGTEGGGERNIDVLFTYLCTHWLVLVCALTRDRTLNLGVSGRRSNQLSYWARALCIKLLSTYFSLQIINISVCPGKRSKEHTLLHGFLARWEPSPQQKQGSQITVIATSLTCVSLLRASASQFENRKWS